MNSYWTHRLNPTWLSFIFTDFHWFSHRNLTFSAICACISLYVHHIPCAVCPVWDGGQESRGWRSQIRGKRVGGHRKSATAADGFQVQSAARQKITSSRLLHLSHYLSSYPIISPNAPPPPPTPHTPIPLAFPAVQQRRNGIRRARKIVLINLWSKPRRTDGPAAQTF